MTLGDLIQALEQADPKLEVRYDQGGYPDEFGSWRGVYAELTLYPNGERKTVGALLKAARKADGATFQGYKGGDFVMGLDTALWADDWGMCNYHAIVDSRVEGGALVLVRANIAEYR